MGHHAADPRAVPVRLEARWISEAFYRMWTSGISLVTWFQLRDDPLDPRGHQATYESGLYFRCARSVTCDRPKPTLTAFRFPFVAFRTGGRVLVWGRTPGGKSGSVAVEQRSGSRWRRLASLRADRYGIFQRKLRPRGSGDLRARLSQRRREVPGLLAATARRTCPCVRSGRPASDHARRA